MKTYLRTFAKAFLTILEPECLGGMTAILAIAGLITWVTFLVVQIFNKA